MTWLATSIFRNGQNILLVGKYNLAQIERWTCVVTKGQTCAWWLQICSNSKMTFYLIEIALCSTCIQITLL